MENNESSDNILPKQIQTEQIKLVNIEKILEKMLEKVNENINTLTVEELQLRASEISEDYKTKLEFSDPVNDIFKEEYGVLETSDQINRQNICLDIFGNPMDDEEYDSE